MSHSFFFWWILWWVPAFSLPWCGNGLKSMRQCKLRATTIESSNEVVLDKTHYIDESIFRDIESSLLNAIGSMSISTSAYYCDELQKHGFSSNIVSKDWMLGHMNYKEKGFYADVPTTSYFERNPTQSESRSTLFDTDNTEVTSSCEWRDYIESMIKIDPLEIKVITFASKGMFPEGSPMRTKYMQRIEPRKIAYKLVQISETIAKELLVDLKTVDNEHEEATRYCRTLLAEGKEVADKSRKPVRLNFEDNDENGTPFREKNWGQIGFLITKIALNLVKLDYQRSGPNGSTLELEKLQQHIDASFQPLCSDPVRRAKQEIMITRQMLESLILEGLKGIVTPASSSQATVNVQVIAEALVQKRKFVASLVRRILQSEDQYLRLQYKKITDFGGFTKLDLGKRPKYELIDLTEELKGAELKEKVLKKTPIERLSYSIASITTSDAASKVSEKLSSPNDATTGSRTDQVDYSNTDDMMIIPMPGCDDYANVMFI